jgi:hypothetical protein
MNMGDPSMVKHVPNMPHIFYKVETIEHNEALAVGRSARTSLRAA